MCGKTVESLGREEICQEIEAEEMLVKIAKQYSSLEFGRWYKGGKDGRLTDEQQKRVDDGWQRSTALGNDVENIKEFIVYLRYLHQFYSIEYENCDLFTLEDLAMIEMTLYQLKFALDKNFSKGGKYLHRKSPFECAFGGNVDEEMNPILRSKRLSIMDTVVEPLLDQKMFGPTRIVETNQLDIFVKRSKMGKIENAPILSEVLQVLCDESHNARLRFNEQISEEIDRDGMKLNEWRFLNVLLETDAVVEMEKDLGEIDLDGGAIPIFKANDLGFSKIAYDSNNALDEILLNAVVETFNKLEGKEDIIKLEHLVFEIYNSNIVGLNIHQLIERIKGPRLKEQIGFENTRAFLWMVENNEFYPFVNICNDYGPVVKQEEWRRKKIVERFREDLNHIYRPIGKVKNAGYNREYLGKMELCDFDPLLWKKKKHPTVDFSCFWNEYNAGRFVQGGEFHVCIGQAYQRNVILEKNYPDQHRMEKCNMYSYDGKCIRCGAELGRRLIRFENENGGYWDSGDYERWIKFKICQNHFVVKSERLLVGDLDKIHLTTMFLTRLLIRVSLGIGKIVECVRYRKVYYVERDKEEFYKCWKLRMRRD